MYQWRFSISSMQLPIQSKGMWILKKRIAAVLHPKLCARTVTYSTEIQGSVSPWWVKGGMSGERPICNYFLLNQHKVAGLQCSTLAWIKTTCGAGWRKAQAQQAPKESAAPFPCKFPRLFDIVRHLIVKEKKKSGLWGLLPFMVSTWIGIKAASQTYFDVFIPLAEMLEGGL